MDAPRHPVTPLYCKLIKITLLQICQPRRKRLFSDPHFLAELRIVLMTHWHNILLLSSALDRHMRTVCRPSMAIIDATPNPAPDAVIITPPINHRIRPITARMRSYIPDFNHTIGSLFYPIWTRPSGCRTNLVSRRKSRISFACE